MIIHPFLMSVDHLFKNLPAQIGLRKWMFNFDIAASAPCPRDRRHSRCAIQIARLPDGTLSPSRFRRGGGSFGS